MSWWGKLIGGTFGFVLGGPLGAILGASLGHNFDRGLGTFAQIEDLGHHHDDVEKIQSAFFTTTFSMMGYIAKLDGRVSHAEIAVAESVMKQMNLDQQQKRVAIALFEKGKHKDFPVADVLQQFRIECNRRRNLLQMFLEIITATALADGGLKPESLQMLHSTAMTLGFSRFEFDSILQRLRASRQMHDRPHQDPASALTDAYKLLGIDRKASDDDLKKAYRRLMNQHHPDKLVAKGLPQEMMEMAHQKTLEIKAAYELVRKSRAS